MLVSTKSGTVVKILSLGNRTTTQRLSALETTNSFLPCFHVAPLTLHDARKFSAEQCGHRDSLVGGKNAGFSQDRFIEG